MSLLLVLLLTPLLLLLFVDWRILALLNQSLRKEAPPAVQGSRTVSVSVIIAARDEEVQLPRLLQSLDRQDYPDNMLEVLIVDDGSTDGTWPLLLVAARKYSWLRPLQYDGSLALPGKQAVLAYATPQSTGKLLLYTDADMVLSPGWVTEMVAALQQQETALVSGTTFVAGDHYQDQLQQVDWVLAVALLYLQGRAGKLRSLLGNNFGIRRKALQKIGGWDALSPTLVEDYALLARSLDLEMPGRQLLSAQPAKTRGLPWSALRRQRSRWMQAAQQLPWSLRLLLVLRWVKPLLWLGLGLIGFWPVAAGFILLNWMLLRMQYGLVARLTGLSMPWIALLTFPIYELLLNLPVWLSLPFVKEIVWKGRSYSS